MNFKVKAWKIKHKETPCGVSVELPCSRLFRVIEGENPPFLRNVSMLLEV